MTALKTVAWDVFTTDTLAWLGPSGDATWKAFLLAQLGITTWNAETIRVSELPTAFAAQIPIIRLLADDLTLIDPPTARGCEHWQGEFDAEFWFARPATSADDPQNLPAYCQRISEALREAVYRGPYRELCKVVRVGWNANRVLTWPHAAAGVRFRVQFERSLP